MSLAKVFCLFIIHANIISKQIGKQREVAVFVIKYLYILVVLSTLYAPSSLFLRSPNTYLFCFRRGKCGRQGAAAGDRSFSFRKIRYKRAEFLDNYPRLRKFSRIISRRYVCASSNELVSNHFLLERRRFSYRFSTHRAQLHAVSDTGHCSANNLAASGHRSSSR